MSNIMLMYHPVKKEVHFLTDDNGSYNEINYTDAPALEGYSPASGEFLLQNQGRTLFDNLSNAFLRIEEKDIVFKGTRLDYEDFKKMVANYNKLQESEGSMIRINLGEFMELPEVNTIYEAIKEVAEATIEIFESELTEGTAKNIYRERRKKLEEKIEGLEQDNVNLCFVGTYSSGKSAFINAIIGEKILPEKIRPETAKMFRIKNSVCPSINFVIKKNQTDSGNIASIIWKEDTKRFQFTTSVNDGVIGELEKICREVKGKSRHEQMMRLLNEINEMPNGYKEDDENFVEGVVDVRYPMDIHTDINFTFYDTPGTDSNSSEHLRILKSALAQQTNSILIVMYTPLKMDGKGNSVLYDLMIKSQEESSNEEGVTIDLSRSLHVVNQVDRHGKTEIQDALKKPIILSRNAQDVVDETEVEEFEYDLQDKRVFYVSSKAAYCAKAIKKGICDSDDEEFIEDFADSVVRKKFYKYNHMSDADFETSEIIKESEAAFEQTKDGEDADKLYIASGMYAIEREIVKYAEKYALAVKAKGLYDAVLYMMDGVEDECKLIEMAKRSDKEKLLAQLKELKEKMMTDIEGCIKAFEEEIENPKMSQQIPELDLIQKKVTNAGVRAEKTVEKLPKVVINADNINKKNRAILEQLNTYLHDIDEYYFSIRASILKQQMDSLKGDIIGHIKEYKDIDQDIIRKITNIGETQIPKSQISGVKMKDYINSEKALWIFTTTDKGKYKEDVVASFLSITGRQFKAYIEEIKEVAKTKAREMGKKFIDNIDRFSATLENVQKEAERVSREQAEAMKCLEIAGKKIDDLESRIWRCVNE